jgi:uncharacterized Zn-binding protein involved in type VI secretion
MPKVAFIGSMTDHGALITTGPVPTPYVTCDCGPIAKMGDLIAAHTHPGVPPIPIPPNPIITGSTVTMIEGIPVARVGDKCA